MRGWDIYRHTLFDNHPWGIQDVTHAWRASVSDGGLADGSWCQRFVFVGALVCLGVVLR